jgi:predicted dehydrogenase
MSWPVTLAMAGTGSRGRTYAGYAERFPDRARLVAVADPRAAGRDRMAERHDINDAHRFADWRELTERPRLADAVVIATPDLEHAEAASSLARLGYHVLLEKPMAPSAAACAGLVEAAETSDVVFAVCHVLRYTAYTRKVREVIESGRLGDVVGIDHLEPVGWWHFAHSYVRGNWRQTALSGPSILTKCCHDLDWLRHLVGRPAQRVSSIGGLHHFTAANRPAGAGERCGDCAVEPDCPYSAQRLYLGFLKDPSRHRWPLPIVTPDLTEEGVRQALRAGPYGRCVYASDNDVADHQVTTIEFDGGLVATLTMSAFTPMARRMTRIMGTHGYLDGDGGQVTVTDFATGRTERAEVSAETDDESASGGHDGGDYGVMKAFTHAVATGDTSQIRSTPRESLESHLMAFAAEDSRASGGHPVAIKLPGQRVGSAFG